MNNSFQTFTKKRQRNINSNSNEDIIIDKRSFFLRNFLYIAMFFILTIAILINFLYGELTEIKVNQIMEFFLPKIEENTGEIENKKHNGISEEKDKCNEHYSMDCIKKKYIYPNYNICILIEILIIFTIIYFCLKNLVEEQKKSIEDEITLEDQIKSNPYLIRQTNEEYKKYCDYYTKIELEKLKKTSQFQLMLAEKGENIANWNWQLRESQNNNKEKIENLSDDDCSHISL